MSLESAYQTYLIGELQRRFPGCFVMKNDSGYRQGIPDLLVLYKDKWAMLEVKAKAGAREQPNQRHYVELFDNMSFSAFIFPENEEEILDELQLTLQPSRRPRVSKRVQVPLGELRRR